MTKTRGGVPRYDLELFALGRHRHVQRWLGAHPVADAVRFAVWAPRAHAVSVVGDFNDWDAAAHPLERQGDSGVWSGIVSGPVPGGVYKYAIQARADSKPQLKADPYARAFELRPNTASRIAPPSVHAWSDADWIARRATSDWRYAPLSIYEVHLGSWQRAEDGAFLGYRELARRLVPYALDLGYTHLELLPLTEHPFDGSWGYQTIGYFAPTARHGDADDLKWFIDHCHQHGLGVILDWCPAHFPADAHALAAFDGAPLYEHADPRRGVHPDWDTLIFDYGRPQVRNFLIASALHWLEEFHFDGLRVDAVASMLYLDYSRKPGEWLPNVHGGRENLEAIAFLRELNEVIHAEVPGAMVLAEESTAWPAVTHPTYVGGLGFSMKWNLGWMHDTLAYLALDPVFRSFHHEKLTFGHHYAFSENFVLPFSHDEVVHGKASLLHKLWGDDSQRFAQLRLLLAFQMTWPGKKLHFMGAEFAQRGEWNHDHALDWALRTHAPHAGIARLVGDLNRLYRDWPALHRHDFATHGFEWLDCHDTSQSVLAYLRKDGLDVAIVVLNFTPIAREDYRIGVPYPGRYSEVLNTDSRSYAGANLGNAGEVRAEAKPWMGRRYSVALTLPAFGALILKPQPTAATLSLQPT